jgi:hypothetical protein
MPDQPIPQNTKRPMNNPLANYFRQPKLYLKLPSHGRFYPEGSLDVSQIDEYAVYAMTAKDELMFKTPDALMNGQSTVEVIKSCIPAIKDPWLMPSLDLDACLIAIRIATFGENMEVTSSCPNCSHLNDFEMNLLGYLDELNDFNYQSSVTIGELTVNIRPYTYKEVTKTAIKAMEQQKIFAIVNDEKMSDEDKLDKFGASFVKLTEITVDVVCGCITSIDTPQGSVSDPTMIKEFMQNSSSAVFNTINDHVNAMKESMALNSQQVQCTECQHNWQVEITMDQANFFAAGS